MPVSGKLRNGAILLISYLLQGNHSLIANKTAANALTPLGYNRATEHMLAGDHARSAGPRFTHERHAIRHLLYSASGFLVGLLVGLTGVGGGSLMTPMLILLFGVHPATAVGTDLLHAAVTKTAGSVVHGFNRMIDWRMVRRLAAGSISATVVTIVALGDIEINSSTARDLINARAGHRTDHHCRDARLPRKDRRPVSPRGSMRSRQSA